jgi:hypothetical protein
VSGQVPWSRQGAHGALTKRVVAPLKEREGTGRRNTPPRTAPPDQKESFLTIVWIIIVIILILLAIGLARRVL